MKYRVIAVLLFLLLFCIPAGVSLAHAQKHPQQESCIANGVQDAQPIYGIFFCQHVDDVHIVYTNHQGDDVTDEYFGTQYTDAATQGCLQYVQTLVLVRYRQDIGGSWVVDCYSDPSNFVSVPGAKFGQGVIDAAVARAQQIVYGTVIQPMTEKGGVQCS